MQRTAANCCAVLRSMPLVDSYQVVSYNMDRVQRPELPHPFLKSVELSNDLTRVDPRP